MINLTNNDENKNETVDVEFKPEQSFENQDGMNNQMSQQNNMNYNQGYNQQMNQNPYNNQQGNEYQNNQNQSMNYNQNNQQGYNNQGYNQMGYNNQQMNQNQQNYNMNQGYSNNMNQNNQFNNQNNMQQQGYMNNQWQMQNGNMPQYDMQQGQNMMNNMNGMNQDMNNQMMVQNNGAVQNEFSADITEYKRRLRESREVQALTSEVDIHNTNSIINFGQKASDNISKISDELLNSMKAVKAEEASEMLSNLTKIMDKFDVKEIENTKSESAFSKLFNRVGNSVAKLFQKYDTMGMEVQKVYVLLKKYENEIKESNNHLKRLYDGNLEYYRILEKYIVAGELAIEEIDGYLVQIPNDQSINPEQQQMLIQKLEISKDMLSQRVYDLQIAENVAIQAAPMIQTIQMSNFNLMRKINSSFIVTLPIFKQCLAQAVILKRQQIQAKSIKQLDDKTNELIMRNASNTARQSVEIAKMASGSSVAIETLQKSFDTIMKGIEETKAIQVKNRQERTENSAKLEDIKATMKRNIAEV